MAQIKQVHSIMIECYDKNVKTPRFLSKHVTSEQKVLSWWNKIPMDDKMIKYRNFTQFWCKVMKLGVLLWNVFIFFIFCIPISSV